MHDLSISKYSKLHMLTMITALTTVLTLMSGGYTIRNFNDYICIH